MFPAWKRSLATILLGYENVLKLLHHFLWPGNMLKIGISDFDLWKFFSWLDNNKAIFNYITDKITK